MTEPLALSQAKLLDGLCQRYGSLPSQVLEEDASVVLGLMNVLAMDADEEAEGDSLSRIPMETLSVSGEPIGQ